MFRGVTMLVAILFIGINCDSSEFARIEPPPTPIVSCENGTLRSCQTGLSQPCTDGISICTNNVWGDCQPNYQTTEEICDNLDNDCNGEIDDLDRRSCSTSCGEGFEFCSDGRWIGCSAPEPTEEICNGIDDDCNNAIDDLVPQTCNRGCQDGLEFCIDGRWQDCNAPEPQPEICDGEDNDCDNAIDEDLAVQCDVECGAGFQLCFMGQLQACEIYVQPEICNGVDDNCNDQIDEEVCFANTLFLVDHSGSMCAGSDRYWDRTQTFISDITFECIDSDYGLAYFGETETETGRIVIPITRPDNFQNSFNSIADNPCLGTREPVLDALYNILQESLNPLWTDPNRHIIIIHDEETTPQGYITAQQVAELLDLLPDYTITVITQPEYFDSWQLITHNLHDINHIQTFDRSNFCTI